VKGIEHGESASRLSMRPGSMEWARSPGPLWTRRQDFVDDSAHGRSPGRVFLDGLDAANEIAKRPAIQGSTTAGANTDQFFPGSGTTPG